MTQGAPKGNAYWKFREKHGRGLAFKTPEALFNAANEYFKRIDENPFVKEEQKKGNVIVPKDAGLTRDEFKEAVKPIVDMKVKRPYTFAGLCLDLGCHQKYIIELENNIIDKLERYVKGSEDYEKAKDFSEVLKYIRNKIESEQFEGSMSGFYNPMITARLRGLKERSDVSTNDKDINLVTIQHIKPGDTPKE